MAKKTDKNDKPQKEAEGKKRSLIAQLKHIWKDPINTMEEAEARKKEIMPWLYGSIGLGLLGSISGIVPVLGILGIFTLIGIVGVLGCILLLFIVKKAKEKFQALTCDKCKTMATLKTQEEFSKYVSYDIAVSNATAHRITIPQANNGVISEISATASGGATARIDLTCPNCGNAKKLEYHIVPFKCSIREKKVKERDARYVKDDLEKKIKEVVDDYNNNNAGIPYSIHSINNPKYEDRAKATTANDTVAYPVYKDVRIDYHKDPDEMVRQFFLENQLDGKIVDPTKAKK